MDLHTKCSSEKCTSPPIFSCECQEPKHFYCLKHLQEHSSLPGNHKAIENFIKIHNRKLMASYFQIAIQQLKRCNEEIVQEAKMQIKAICNRMSEALNEIRKIEKENLANTDYLLQNKYIIKSSNSSDTETFILKFIDSPIEIISAYRKLLIILLKIINLEK